MSDEFADLLGDDAPAPPRNKGGRPTREQAAAKALQERMNLAAAASGRALEDVGGVQALRRPVTINTLATVFGHDVQTITRRLIDCPFTQHGNRKLYSFKEACSYIVKPRMTPEQFMKTLNSSHLPPDVNKAVWDGQRSRLKYMIESQEAWETHEVADAMGALCMTVKECHSTMTETMRERARLTDEQAAILDACIDDLKERLAEKLEELAERTQTPAMIGKPLFGAPGVSVEIPQDDEDDEYDDYGDGDE
jgi:hypothetical protein